MIPSKRATAYQRELGESQAERAGDLPPTVRPDLGNASVGMEPRGLVHPFGVTRVQPPYTLRVCGFLLIFDSRNSTGLPLFPTPFKQTRKRCFLLRNQADGPPSPFSEGTSRPSSSLRWCALKPFKYRRRKRYVQRVRVPREQKGVHPGIPTGYPRPHA